jgi:4-amino-4-deoxy-L-arabinose transferase-like glycosyltransferase
MKLAPRFFTFQLPPSGAALAALALAFVLPGLAGHDPWKSHDALGLGVAWEMALSGDAVVPRIGEVAWLADPPLYHWFAAALGQLLAPLLPFHSGARLASGIFMLAALWLIRVAGRDWSLGEERSAFTGAGALLLLLGSVGLMVHAHEAVPELAGLAALCGGLAVLPHATRRPAAAGVLFGAALGFAFLASGWLPPAALGLAVLAAHGACAEWRTRAALPFLACAAVVGALMAIPWPLALARKAPELLAAWWQFSAGPAESPGGNLRYLFANIGWFAWPVWPLALWAAWVLRRRWSDPRVLVPGLAALFLFAGLAIWGPSQSISMIPLLAPLCLLGAQGIPTLRRGAAAALDWFGVVTFAFFAGLVWLGYVAMMTGVPPRVAANFARLAPGFAPQFDLVPLAVALALAAGWLYVVFLTPPSPLRSVTRWAAGMTLLWGTFAMLWMPWADHQKSYRSVARELQAKIPAGYEACISALHVGLPQRAAIHYHAGIRTRPYDLLQPRACPLVLMQAHPSDRLVPEGWVQLADVGRPGDRNERLRLYRIRR